MLRRGKPMQPVRHTDNEWHPRLAAEHVPDFCNLIDQFIHRAEHEIGNSDFDDGARPCDRCTQSHVHDHAFGDWRTHYSRAAKLFEKTPILQIYATILY